MPPADKTILLRTVAGFDFGYGHLTRCLSLAQALASLGARPVFALAAADAGARSMLAEAGVEVAEMPGSLALDADLALLLELAGSRKAAAVVLDGYGFDQAYLDSLSKSIYCLYMDDTGALAPTSSLVLNPNPAARPEDYGLAPGQRLLLGLRYVLLRQVFGRLRAERPRRTPEVATNLLITFGGADPNRLCARVLTALADSQYRYAIRVIAGGLPASLAATRAAARDCPHQVTVHERVSDMAGAISWADLAICGSGVTGYEMCCLGLPMIVVTPVDNLLPVSRGLESAGLIRNLGWWEDVPGAAIAGAVDQLAGAPEQRKRLSEAGQLAVDGLGAHRVAKILLEASPGPAS